MSKYQVDDVPKRKVIGITFIIEEHLYYEHNYKYSTRQKIERTMYRALLLSCGHTIKISNKANEKMKTTRCYSCWSDAKDAT